METDKLSIEKNFELITQVITQARNRFEENGFIYMFWGVLIAIASIGQFILLDKGLFAISWYPYLLMPIGGLFSMYYFAKRKGKSQGNLIARIVSFAWVLLSINMGILGFVFYSALKENLIPVILILLSVGTITSAVSIKSKLLVFSGILINLSAFISFTIEWIYQPLLMGIVSIVAIAIPGVILMVLHKRK